MDEKVFSEEQKHLTKTYGELQGMEQELQDRIEKLNSDAAQEKNDIRDNLRFDFADDEVTTETYGEIMTWNQYVDSMNVKSKALTDQISAVRLLLKAPYFARIRLQMDEEDEADDYYIGNANVNDKDFNPIIIDWRSPIAETYYNQENGRTSYEVNGRRIECDLKLRRQFDLTGDHLNAYFDTQVAIEDQLLLQSLTKQRSDKMQAITSTIQKEQNAVIRYPDVSCLIVSGIAGSGKTSVLLQRIAYLFYRQRKTLRPDQVVLMTLNPVFRQYIDEVLPDLGETNPTTMTWQEFCSIVRVPIVDGAHSITTLDDLKKIDELLPAYELQESDLVPVDQKGRRILTTKQVLDTLNLHPEIPLSVRKINVGVDDLEDAVREVLRRKGKKNAGQDDADQDDGDAPEETQADENRMQNDNGGAIRQVHTFGFLNVEKIAKHLLHTDHVTAIQYLYLRMKLTGECDRQTRYVMIDEVQDYSQAQIYVLMQYFPQAKFMMLGDEFQAIRPGTASFAQIREIFESAGKEVKELSLMTSYRSSPEITNLFVKLLPDDLRGKTASVRRPGLEPKIETAEGDEAYAKLLRDSVSELQGSEGLTAVICENRRSLKKVRSILQDLDIPTIDPGDHLPKEGIFLIELSLCKGLEFDNVILPDVDANRYPDETLSRHRLYTAISRAMQKLIILAQDHISPMLED